MRKPEPELAHTDLAHVDISHIDDDFIKPETIDEQRAYGLVQAARYRKAHPGLPMYTRYQFSWGPLRGKSDLEQYHICERREDWNDWVEAGCPKQPEDEQIPIMLLGNALWYTSLIQ